MAKPTTTQQRGEMLSTFKDVLTYLRQLDRHHKKVKLLDEEELEHLTLSVDFAMEELCDAVNDQLAQFGLIEPTEDQIHDEERSRAHVKGVN